MMTVSCRNRPRDPRSDLAWYNAQELTGGPLDAISKQRAIDAESEGRSPNRGC